MTNKRNYRLLVWLLAITCLFTISTQAQTPVALSPVPAQQFLSNTGVPLASGCIYTYITGTSTPLATYTDSTGTVQSLNPIILDAGGYASGVNGTGGLWLSNATYRFQIWSFGSGAVGSNCGNGTLQRTVDGVSAYSIINQAQNLFLSCQSSDPSGTAGELGCRSDLSKIRAFTTLWDSIVEETVAATLTNKILSNPAITGSVTGGATYVSPVLTNPSINGTTVSGPPATYLVLSNDITTGTTSNTLTKMLGATAIIASTADTGGMIGITVSGAGKTGSATIQQSGSVSCVFDGATTAGDYVQISTTVAGNCHDIGSAIYPVTGQPIGRSQLTAGVAGTYALVLFGPEIKAVNPVAAQTAYLTSNFTQTGTVFANVAGLSFSASASTKYKVSCDLDYQVTGNGIQIQWTGPAAATFVTYDMNAVLTTGSATVSPGVATAFSTALSGNTTGVTGTNLPIHLSMTLSNGVNAGTVQLQAASTGAGGTVTIIPGACTIQQ